MTDFYKRQIGLIRYQFESFWYGTKWCKIRLISNILAKVDWMRTNTSGLFYIEAIMKDDMMIYQYIVYFEKDEDFVLFKLTWDYN